MADFNRKFMLGKRNRFHERNKESQSDNCWKFARQMIEMEAKNGESHCTFDFFCDFSSKECKISMQSYHCEIDVDGDLIEPTWPHFDYKNMDLIIKIIKSKLIEAGFWVLLREPNRNFGCVTTKLQVHWAKDLFESKDPISDDDDDEIKSLISES